MSLFQSEIRFISESLMTSNGQKKWLIVNWSTVPQHLSIHIKLHLSCMHTNPFSEFFYVFHNLGCGVVQSYIPHLPCCHIAFPFIYLLFD